MNGLRNTLKMLVPKKALFLYYLRNARKACMPDIRRRVYDKVYNDSEADKVKRDLTLAYHIVEKGLTMPVPRPGFGRKVIMGLVDTIFRYRDLGLPLNSLEFTQSVSSLKEYTDFHKSISFSLDNELSGKLDSVAKAFGDVEGIPQIRTSREDYLKAINQPFDSFCMSRYSVRNYTDKPVPMQVLYDCIELAQKSPSFCNRQPTRVHIVKSSLKKKEILEIQNGNRGFGHLADTLLVISSVISTTKDIHERNENHLNGGIFIMTLLNALHFNEIGACSLNWSVSDDKDIKIRKILKLPENEIVLMIISCGYLPDNFSVASSPRKKASEITTEHL